VKRAGGFLLPALALAMLAGPSARAEDSALRLKQVMYMSPSNQSGGPAHYIPIFDMDHDGLLEMTYRSGRADSMATNPQRLEIGRFLPYNRWLLLWADTCKLPPLPGINRAYFVPGDVGDPDEDGLIDVVGHNWKFDSSSGGPTILCNLEQRTEVSLPDSTTWTFQVFSGWGFIPTVQLAGHLDSDNSEDILDFVGDTAYLNHTIVIENRGRDQYSLAWTAPDGISGILAVGDLDLDEVKEFAGALEGDASVWRSCSDNQYEQVFADSTGLYNGGNDCFFGRDVNRNGRPEFYASFARYIFNNDWMCYLLAWEADGGTYRRITVDSAFVHNFNPYGRSICADIDGDGMEEVIWATTTALHVYKGDAAGNYERVGTWNNYLNSGGPACANVNAADVNYDGYNEVVVTCHLQAAVLEVEAIQVLTPSRRTTYDPGDTCRISWRTFNPPRCDSVSLFLRADTTYELDTIAHGLAPDDTPYVWVVPDIRADSAYVMAIAYGPGWQYDESDSAIRILGTGIGEERPVRVRELRLTVAPNPVRGPAHVSYDLPVSVPVELSVLDPAGRKVTTLTSGQLGSGQYQAVWNRQDRQGRALPAGVYFVRLAAGERTRLVKLVLTGEER
jgi:hypothetical protein